MSDPSGYDAWLTGRANTTIESVVAAVAEIAREAAGERDTTRDETPADAARIEWCAQRVTDMNQAARLLREAQALINKKGPQ